MILSVIPCALTNCTIGELTSIALDRVKEAYKEGAK